MKKVLLFLIILVLVGCAKSVEKTDINQTDLEQPVPVIDHNQEVGKVKLNIIEPETIETSEPNETSNNKGTQEMEEVEEIENTFSINITDDLKFYVNNEFITEPESNRVTLGNIKGIGGKVHDLEENIMDASGLLNITDWTYYHAYLSTTTKTVFHRGNNVGTINEVTFDNVEYIDGFGIYKGADLLISEKFLATLYGTSDTIEEAFTN